MNSETRAEPAGLYIHIPFCLKKCSYCDFFSITDLTLLDEFIIAMLREMERVGNSGLFFDTLYLGGGTPSLLEAEQAAQIITAAYENFNLAPSAEITMEMNPGTLTLAKLRGYRAVGVNRINIGIQSLRDINLNFLGRIHSASDAVASVQTARDAGFDNIGLDLIYGLPGQSVKDWTADLKKTVQLRPEHLSCYILTFEQGTPLAQAKQAKHFVPLSEAEVGDLFEVTASFLQDKGYKQYEISNFALESKLSGTDLRSRHNRKYWLNNSYIGIGPSAHSYIEPERWWNISDLKEYIKSISENILPVAGKEILSSEQRIMESIFLGLRTSEGIDIEKFKERFGLDFYEKCGAAVASLEDPGYLTASRRRLALTSKGFLLHDSLTAIFLEAFSDGAGEP